MSLVDILAALSRALAQAGFAHMVVGGQAVLLYGEPRLTRDIDLTLATGLDHATELLALLDASDWRALPADAVAFAARHLVLPCTHNSGLRGDFIFGLTPYERQAVGRARPVALAGVHVPFAAVEDLVLHKLFAGRPRDLEDVRGILHRRPEVDAAYLQGWLEQFDRDLDLSLRARWERLRAESDG